MTDPRTPPPDDSEPVDPDVELASALVDGEAAPGASDRLADDEELAATVERFGAIADRVADVTPPPPGLADRHIAAALDELGAPELDPGDETPPASGAGGRAVVALPWWHRVPLGAVAAVVLVVALVGALGALTLVAGDDDDRTDSATAALDERSDDGGGATNEATSSAEGAEESATFDAEPAPTVAVPTVDDLDALAAAVGAQTDSLDAAAPGAGRTGASDANETADASAPVDPCDAVGAAAIDPGSVLLVQDAVVAGEAVTAVVHGEADDRRLVVVTHGGCDVVLDRAL